ncbi:MULTISPECIES: carbohydrate ABC transporter permease [Rhizobium/Agrobacterium group]|uniref:sn-glycerol-3-phosphate transport system permease protein UgpA n=1 Tax=Agrobacterium vitis TaxID=373 RepID=A0A120DBY9_AGRVI|nr:MULTISPECIES: sugar ABC transporter permease [Rhizobium/Agrobacterium group]MCF1497229.1 sugar ABC transporter permease [Allorhizobium sp. Av2]KAA3518480.1 sugar ABC transporter permease [Agrobacterium vitis]KAA3530076.1 sugar ABC transporter permease [Agrobacterium vitis]MBF2713599.1 sugar ABC transporter permease [Agrobacterium vitis]MCF1465626.1 sugar ABC transporter permease [Agrobacterium vitis]
MEQRAVFKNWWLPILFALPQIILIILFFYWPVAAVVNWAFTLEPPFGGAAEFVGFANFKDALTDPFYWNSVYVSLIFATVGPFFAILIGLVLALAVDRQLPGTGFFRFFYILPFAIAGPAAGIAFRFILAPDRGLAAMVNSFSPDLWNPAKYGSHALALVIIVFIWKWSGYTFIFLLAGLQSVPRALSEAAAMDGAGPLRRAFDVQVPLLAPTLFFLLVTMMTEGFVGADTFGIVHSMTGGGPNHGTEVMVYRIVDEAFKGLNYSGASAQSIILIGLIMICTFIQFRFIEKRVHYK